MKHFNTKVLKFGQNVSMAKLADGRLMERNYLLMDDYRVRIGVANVGRKLHSQKKKKKRIWAEKLKSDLLYGFVPTLVKHRFGRAHNKGG